MRMRKNVSLTRTWYTGVYHGDSMRLYARQKGEESGRAPAIVSCAWLRKTFQLRPGNPAAPREAHLPLLPSGPDGVRKHLPRGDRILITFASLGAGWHKTSGGNSAPHLERFECWGSPSSPPSTTSHLLYPFPHSQSNALSS